MSRISCFDVLDSVREWTFYEEEFLRNWFFDVSIGICAEWLRRSVSDVQRKAVFMGLLLRINDGFDDRRRDPPEIENGVD